MVNKKNLESDNTEERILEAAKKIFYQKGHDGARMQEIADEAGINKAMLHYYFRTKNQLFEKIFLDALLVIIPGIATVLGSDKPLKEKFIEISDFYFDLLSANPLIPVFVFQTLQRDPDKLIQYVTDQKGIVPQDTLATFMMQIQSEVMAGNIAPIDPRQMLLNLVSMSVFPFLMKPVFTKLVGMKEDQFLDFADQRRQLIPEFMMKIMKPDSD